jgi:hypothetical protein
LTVFRADKIVAPFRLVADDVFFTEVFSFDDDGGHSKKGKGKRKKLRVRGYGTKNLLVTYVVTANFIEDVFFEDSKALPQMLFLLLRETR